MAAVLIIVAFGVAGTFAQLMANTSRVIIVNYSMPVWGSVMAYLVLGERINRQAAIGLALCVAGLTVLIYPVMEQSVQRAGRPAAGAGLRLSAGAAAPST